MTAEETNQSIETILFCIHLNAQQGESFKQYFEREKILKRIKSLVNESKDREIAELKRISLQTCEEFKKPSLNLEERLSGIIL